MHKIKRTYIRKSLISRSFCSSSFDYDISCYPFHGFHYHGCLNLQSLWTSTTAQDLDLDSKGFNSFLDTAPKGPMTHAFTHTTLEINSLHCWSKHIYYKNSCDQKNTAWHRGMQLATLESRFDILPSFYFH